MLDVEYINSLRVSDLKGLVSGLDIEDIMDIMNRQFAYAYKRHDKFIASASKAAEQDTRKALKFLNIMINIYNNKSLSITKNMKKR